MNILLHLIDLTSLTLGKALAVLGTAVGLALVLSLTYYFTHRRMALKSSVMMTILLMGPIASIIVLVVGNSLARAVSIGGGIALVRYRYTMHDPRDLLYLFLSLAIGMACGVGAIGYAALATAVICLVLIVANLVGFDMLRTRMLKLKITVPEDINYVGMFEPVLKKYCKIWKLEKVKTTEYGTLIDLHYHVRMNDLKQQKELIDDVRCLNGNLAVVLSETADDRGLE
jgi:hypothetical protein